MKKTITSTVAQLERWNIIREQHGLPTLHGLLNNMGRANLEEYNFQLFFFLSLHF